MVLVQYWQCLDMYSYSFLGFTIVIEPLDEKSGIGHSCTLHLSCMDASVAIRPIFQRYHTVVITSGVSFLSC